MKVPSIQRCYLLGLLIVVVSLFLAGYLQYAKGLQPCPLCQLQRICMGVIGFLFLFAVLQRPKRMGIKRYGWAILFFSCLGSLLAGRQIILQMFPPQGKMVCGVSLDYMIQALPAKEVMKFVFLGIGDCSRVDWRLIGLSLAEWTLIGFVILGILAWAQNWRVKKVV